MRAAAYLRYSSDKQNDASIDDQLRNIRNWCARHDVAEPAIYCDAAISGSRDDRPEYARLISDASTGRLDLILVDDLSRFSRDNVTIGRIVKRLTFSGVRLVGVSDGVDTQRRGHKIDVGLRGLMSELYLDDLAEKTHRGLTGRALSGSSAGGLPYGYRVTNVGERAIDEEQAVVVRRIFELAASGVTPRKIAATLNADGIPTARGKTWSMTSIYGDRKRGIGILANPIYVGRQIWNRSQWVKHPETGRRVRRERPESEWIITEHPELAIVSQELWDRAHKVAARRRSGGRPGRRSRHLLSGLLRCHQCGGPLVVVDRYNYGCGRAKDKGAAVCSSRLRVPRDKIEDAMLEQIRAELLTPAAFKEFEREARRLIKSSKPDLRSLDKALKKAEAERENIMSAIRAGIVTESTKAELVDAESRVAEARQAIDAVSETSVDQLIPRAREVWKRCVAELQEIRDVPQAREAIRDILGGEIVVKEKAPGILIAEADSQINVVAGAGFEPATSGL